MKPVALAGPLRNDTGPRDFQMLHLAVLTGIGAITIVVFALQAGDIGGRAALVYQVPGLSMLVAAYVVDTRFALRGAAALLAVSSAVWIATNVAVQNAHPLPRDIAALFVTLPLSTLLHAVLAMPSGHLRRRLDRGVVAVSYVMALVISPVVFLLSPVYGECRECPPAVLVGTSAVPDVVVGLLALLGQVVSLVAGGVLFRRWRRESQAGRRLLGPVLVGGVYVALSNASGSLADDVSSIPTFQFEAGHRVSDALALNFIVAISVGALLIPYGVHRATRSAGAFGRVAPRLSGEPTVAVLRPLVASALGDQSVQLDLDPTPIPERALEGRAHTDVTFAGSLVARIDHDEVLLVQREALNTVVSTLGLLLGRRRLEQDVIAHESHLRSALDSSIANSQLTNDLQQLRSAFDAYVDPDVAERVLDAQNASVASETVDVTVLFLDVRDFTTYAERTSAAEVVGLLNSFWELVVPLIQDHGGHANKFIGDGLLAVFGAPQPLAHHADHAVAAARAIAAAVTDEYGGDIAIGIGLNSGDVMAGSVGGGGRLEFTVIGDVVNTAARVESATRATGDTVLITENTRDRLTAHHQFAARPGHMLKGKAGTVDLHALVGV